MTKMQEIKQKVASSSNEAKFFMGVFLTAGVIVALVATYLSFSATIEKSYQSEIQRVKEEHENIYQTKCADPTAELNQARKNFISNFPGSGITHSEIFEWIDRTPSEDINQKIASAKKIKQLEVIQISSCKEASEEIKEIKPVVEGEYAKAQWKKIVGISE